MDTLVLRNYPILPDAKVIKLFKITILIKNNLMTLKKPRLRTDKNNLYT